MEGHSTVAFIIYRADFFEYRCSKMEGHPTITFIIYRADFFECSRMNVSWECIMGELCNVVTYLFRMEMRKWKVILL